ncbi:hypothetical protein CEXT_650341 [Caerostris extrusa]|uniref:Uncharacterized protein n=1 Tax=Caerostris extrusa TaxID=172846 RepID=A0AAV4MZR5_CAEEX|nr:hypothetical protein CEXT_650341 [Caerostris extrusa]
MAQTEKITDCDFTEGISVLINFAKDIEAILKKDKNMVKTTKQAAKAKFAELEMLFAQKELQIAELKAQIRLYQTKESNEIAYYRGKLEENQNILKDVLRENTDSFKKH